VQEKRSKIRSVPAISEALVTHPDALVEDAFSSMRKSAQGSTTTARLKTSKRPCSGMLVRSAVGVLTTASCC
jgi:3-phosphoglycerate kinase